MIDLDPIIPHLKAFHISFMCVWMAGLAVLPAMLARHDPAIGQWDFARIRHATHYGYIWAVTPAAALAIGSGLALIFLSEVFVPWMLAKLFLVGGLVALHAWIGHTIIAVAETQGHHRPPSPFFPVLILIVLSLGVLLLVLAKPELDELPVPDWLRQPLERELPFDVPKP